METRGEIEAGIEYARMQIEIFNDKGEDEGVMRQKGMNCLRVEVRKNNHEFIQAWRGGRRKK